MTVIDAVKQDAGPGVFAWKFPGVFERDAADRFGVAGDGPAAGREGGLPVQPRPSCFEPGRWSGADLDRENGDGGVSLFPPKPGLSGKRSSSVFRGRPPDRCRLKTRIPGSCCRSMPELRRQDFCWCFCAGCGTKLS